jgi:hypothetical protein
MKTTECFDSAAFILLSMGLVEFTKHDVIECNPVTGAIVQPSVADWMRKPWRDLQRSSIIMPWA